jgi:NADH:ubiquinone oxidoreductase subunit K
MNTQFLFYLASFLFCVGISIVITRRNLIMILVGTELMLNAANLNLVAFNRQWSGHADGQLFALFVIIIAVCETAVGLAIILRAYHFYGTSVPDQIAELKEKN